MERMKALRNHRFSGPDVLRLEDVSRPTPVSDERLIRVHAATMNPIDRNIRRGIVSPFLGAPWINTFSKAIIRSLKTVSGNHYVCLGLLLLPGGLLIALVAWALDFVRQARHRESVSRVDERSSLRRSIRVPRWQNDPSYCYESNARTRAAT